MPGVGHQMWVSVVTALPLVWDVLGTERCVRVS